MNWGSILKLVGKGALAVGTGGASLAAPGVGLGSMVGDATDLFSKASGNAAQGMANNRGTGAEIRLDQNADLESQLLAREREKRAAGSAAYRSAMVGQHAANFQPSTRPAGIPGSYQSTGTSPEARMAGGTLFSEGMRRMLGADQVNQTGLPDYKNLMNDPEFQNLLHSGKLEKFLGIASVASPLIGQLLKRGTGSNPAASGPPTSDMDTGILS